MIGALFNSSELRSSVLDGFSGFTNYSDFGFSCFSFDLFLLFLLRLSDLMPTVVGCCLFCIASGFTSQSHDTGWRKPGLDVLIILITVEERMDCEFW